ncbi:pyridoxal phosphate-dependent aminotransferase [Actinosynnema sp. NPDC002837]
MGRWVPSHPNGDVVDLMLGTPRHPPTAESVVRAAIEALQGDHNQYAAPVGDESLRIALSERLTGSPHSADEFIVTVGATEALAATLLTLVDDDDEVVLLDPHYPNFAAALALTGGRPRFVRLRPPEWKLDLDSLRAAMNERTRVLLVNSPHNPTGSVLSRADLSTAADWCAERGIWLVCDEVYRDFVYDGAEFTSVSDLTSRSEHTISIGSFSKSHAVSGWRIGYVRAAPVVASRIRAVHEVLTGGAPAPFQHALTLSAEAVGGSELQRARDLALQVFRDTGFACATPQGGFYFTVAVPDGFRNAEQFCGFLADRVGVLLLPGSAFTADDNPAGHRFARVAFNRSDATLADAASRLWALPPHNAERRGVT